MKVEFCLPIYNEEKILKENINRLLRFCHSKKFDFDWKIVILNNGSSDKSEEICRDLVSPRIKIVNELAKGKGKAIKNYWNKTSADIVLYMDIDLAVSLDNIIDLVLPVINKESDLVIGSRLLRESKIERSLIRECSSQTYNLLSRLTCKHKFSDLQCGFKAIRSDIFKKIYPFMEDEKWFFDTELIIFANVLGYRIKEIPVEWSENRYDNRKSKINLARDTFKFVINLIKLKKRIRQLKKNN
ncbi:MAG: glycosyltransferase [Patescibacteria group bacterium]|jgi:glycosyltransferase involved in cell wall biosynthesis